MLKKKRKKLKGHLKERTSLFIITQIGMIYVMLYERTIDLKSMDLRFNPDLYPNCALDFREDNWRVLIRLKKINHNLFQQQIKLIIIHK